MQISPNPSNPSTIIEFMLPKSASVTVKVFNVTGAEVKTIVGSKNYSAGSHKVTFNAAGLASGIYFYQLETADFIQTKKMFSLR